MKTIIRRIKALFNGQYKNFIIYRCLILYYRTPRKKKLLVSINELILLTIHWKTFPYQYFQFEMFLNSCILSHQEMKNYLPSKRWVSILDVSNIYKILCNDKALFCDLLRSNNLPQPQLLFKYHKGTFLNHKNELLSTLNVNEIISSQKCKRIFVKDALGLQGLNIVAYDRTGDEIFFMNGTIALTAENILAHFPNSHLIIQEGIIQSKVLSKVNFDSVNTVRVLTRNNGEVSIIAAAVRFGRKGKVIDNAHAGGIAVGVDLETGKLNPFAKAYYDINEYYEHPDSGAIFADIQLDSWDEIKSIVTNAARCFYQIEFIGWDVVITDSGILILEMNKEPCIHFQQMVSGGLADKICN